MLIIIISLFIFPNIESRSKNIYNQQGCDYDIHRKCLYKVNYSEQELENVRLYLAQRFQNANPLKPICKRLYVRKDIKCLTNKELTELIDEFKELYRTGIYDKYSWIHSNHWFDIHKYKAPTPWHRWHVLQLEKELQKINPNLSMPYWDPYLEFSAPERSSIWDIFGKAGNQNNSFCVPDGPFANISVKYPNPHCIKRQWNSDLSISPWEFPEWVTSYHQTAKTWLEFSVFSTYAGHFKVHLNIGGYNGDMSIEWATNDPVFYLYHTFQTDLAVLKWQLSGDSNLVPQSYTGFRIYLSQLNRFVTSNLETDVLVYYSNTRVKEAFEVGFGDLCYIHDQLITPINNIINKIDQEQPIAIRILIGSLPKVTIKRYFPKFADKTFTIFDHILPNIRNCVKPKKMCKPIPIAESYNKTLNGLRQIEKFGINWGYDVSNITFDVEAIYFNFSNELRQKDYCSPFVN